MENQDSIPESMFLGKLCKHNHNFLNTGFSLRYKKHGRRCVACVKNYQKVYRERSEVMQYNSEYHAKYNKAYRAKPENRERAKELAKIYNKLPKAKVHMEERQRRYREKLQRARDGSRDRYDRNIDYSARFLRECGVDDI